MVQLTVAKADAEAASRRGRPRRAATANGAEATDEAPRRRGRPRRERPEPTPRFRQPLLFEDGKAVRAWLRQNLTTPLVTTAKHEQRLARLEALPDQREGVLAYARFESGWSYQHAVNAGIPGSEIIYGLKCGYLIPQGAELPPPVEIPRRTRAPEAPAAAPAPAPETPVE